MSTTAAAAATSTMAKNRVNSTRIPPNVHAPTSQQQLPVPIDPNRASTKHEHRRDNSGSSKKRSGHHGDSSRSSNYTSTGNTGDTVSASGLLEIPVSPDITISAGGEVKSEAPVAGTRAKEYYRNLSADTPPKRHSENQPKSRVSTMRNSREQTSSDFTGTTKPPKSPRSEAAIPSLLSPAESSPEKSPRNRAVSAGDAKYATMPRFSNSAKESDTFSPSGSQRSPKKSAPPRAQDVFAQGSEPATRVAESDRMSRAKTGIVTAIREVQSSLQEIDNAILQVQDHNDLLNKVKVVRAIKVELQKASDCMPLGTYTYSLPTTDDKLQLAKVIVSYETSVNSRLLDDIEGGLQNLENPNHFIVVLKILKSVISLCKDFNNLDV